MFVTFDCAETINRNSSEIIWKSLALKWPKPEALVEIRLDPPDASKPLRFPTVADAGWYSFFLSAGQTELHGWTSPHDHTPHLPKQPEAVLEPLCMSVLSGPDCVRVI